MSANLQIPQMTSGEVDKETLFNDAIAALDGALTDAYAFDASADVVIDYGRSKQYVKLRADNVPSAGSKITLASNPHIHILSNNGASVGIATFQTSQGTFDVAPGKSAMVYIDATGINAVVSAGTVSLADLSDVDFSTPPTNGQALVFNSTTGKWKPGNVSSGGTTPPVSAFRYYKIVAHHRTGSNDNQYTGLATLALRNTAGGPNVLPTALLGDAQSYTQWFDNDDTTVHEQSGAPSPTFILDYGAPQSFVELYLAAYPGYNNEAPGSYDISASTDNVTYTAVQTVASPIPADYGSAKVAVALAGFSS